MSAYSRTDLEALASGQTLPRETFDAIVRDREAVRIVWQLVRLHDFSSGEGETKALGPQGEGEGVLSTVGPQAGEMRTPPLPPEEGGRIVPPQLEGFVFLEALGSGSFGQVWKARDVTLDRLCAVKVVTSDGLDEGRTLAKLPTHRNRAQVFALHPQPGGACLVMEFVQGRNLLQLVRQGALPWPVATLYAAQIAEGLREVHKAGIVHRDVKPANVLLDEGRGEAVLVDFGLAAPLKQGEGAGTLAYVAPEAAVGEASPKSDVYSLGATLLHLVTGRLPWPPVVPEDLPRPLRELLRAALELDEARRIDLDSFQARARRAEVEELADRMEELAHGRPERMKVVVSTARAGSLDFRIQTPSGRTAGEGGVMRVRTGDLVRLEVTPSQDGYVTVLCFGSGGGLSVLYSGAQESRPARAGQTEQLSFRADPPPGTDTFAVVWSMQPWTFGEQEWRRLLGGGSMGMRTRKMTLVSARTLREDETWAAAVVTLEQER